MLFETLFALSLLVMSDSSVLTVLLSLSSGETFEDIPVTDLEVTLGEFLDVSLKALEVSNFCC